MKTSTTTPRLYVGTYAKYNNDSINGAWLDEPETIASQKQAALDSAHSTLAYLFT